MLWKQFCYVDVIFESHKRDVTLNLNFGLYIEIYWCVSGYLLRAVTIHDSWVPTKYRPWQTVVLTPPCLSSLSSMAFYSMERCNGFVIWPPNYYET